MLSQTLRPGLLALGLLTLLPAAPALGANATVTVADKTLTPAAVTIQPGESVTWSWTEGGHNVRIIEGPVKFDSGFKEAGGTYARAFASVGVYRYLCDAHPDMRGSVTVGTPGSAPVGPAPATAAGPTTGAPAVALRLSGVSVSRLAVVSLRASAAGRVRARLLRGSRVVRRWTVAVQSGANRVPLGVRGIRLGRYRVELQALDGTGRPVHRVRRALVVTPAARARRPEPLRQPVAAPSPAPQAPAPAPAPGQPADVPDDSDGRVRPEDSADRPEPEDR